jgi:tetratricopeptide (TPR) repeat protein
MRSGLLRVAAVGLLAGPTACGARGTADFAAAADTSIVSRSIEFLETRLAADPNNYLAAGHLVGRYLTRFGLAADAGDVERAEALARRLTTLAPDHAAAMSRLSGVLLTQHKFAESLAAARAAVAADSGDDDARGALFDATLASGAYDEAEATLRTMRPGSLATLVRRAQWLDATGHAAGAREGMDRACRRLEQSAARPATVAWCLTELAGLVHREWGPEAAGPVLERALRVQPGYRGAVERMAHLAASREDWPAAYRLYRQIAADAHPDLYLRLSEAAGRLRREDERLDWQRRFLAIVSRPEKEALFGAELALFLAERNEPGDRAAALAIAGREIVRRPTVESYDLLAWVHYRRGELNEALAASSRALDLGAPSPGMEYHRGRILHALGRTAEGQSLIQRAETQPSLLPPHARLDRARRPAGARG